MARDKIEAYGIGTIIKTNERYEPEYELLSIRYGKLTRSVSMTFSRTSYEYTPARLKGGRYESAQMRVVIKTVKKKVKASELSTLTSHADPVICAFCECIVKNISDTRLHPSWYKALCLERECERETRRFDRELKELFDAIDRDSAPYREEAKRISRELLALYSEIEGERDALELTKKKLIAFDENKKKFPSSLLFWRYSTKSRVKITDEMSERECNIEKGECRASTLETRLSECASEISELERRRTILSLEIETQREKYLSEQKRRLCEITSK